MGFKRQTEASFQATLERVAVIHGWTVYHTRDSRGSSGGFPDLILTRGPRYNLRVIVAELKLAGKRPRPDQERYLDAFASALGADRVFLWTPGDWNEIQAVLSQP